MASQSTDDLWSFLPFHDDAEEVAAPKLVTDLVTPWLVRERIARGEEGDVLADSPPFVRFHNEMLAFCDFIRPTSAELQVREKALQEITEAIQADFPNATVHVFGSQLTKILTPTSDLDIVVMDEDNPLPATAILYAIGESVKKKNLASYLEVISTAKVPIVKFDHAASGISVDICCNNDSGLVTGKLMKQYIQEYPPLHVLTLVLKMFLSQRKLNETYSGGIGSFVLSCMIVSFLQMRRRNEVSQGIEVSWNLGLLLLDFFSLYGGSYNYMHTGISIANGGSYHRKRDRDGGFAPNRRDLLSVENPSQPELDMGRNSFMMYKIRRSFEHAHQVSE
jgi:non-canonical poly(A) RNA polymerase PAPD5/7